MDFENVMIDQALDRVEHTPSEEQQALRNATVVVDGSRIASVGPSTATPTFDFPALTLLPGLIDTHVHLEAHFGCR